jgi:LuxR family maltose regulon positive regulatory protein
MEIFRKLKEGEELQTIPLIQTKVMIPAIKQTDLRRAKLTKKLKGLHDYPLTIVHAGAGYGKSTALALYVTDEKKKCCWYSISAIDDDILPFLSYLLAAIRTNFPDFGRELENYIHEMDRYAREQELNLLCSLFINEILSVKEDVLLILDDFHHLEQSHAVNRWMEILLEHFPLNLHLVIITRSRPVWNVLAKMKAKGGILEITKDDLVLTKEEVELLLNENFGMTLKESELNRIYQLTEGWVIALGMIAGQNGDSLLLGGEGRSGLNSLQDLFQYLALEVFANQPDDIRQFLKKTSILEEMNEEICNAVLQIDTSKQWLAQLTLENLFIQKISEKDFRYHALFREFLEKQLIRDSYEDFQQLHERAAQYFEANGQVEKALLHYEKIKQTAQVKAILQKYGMKMLESGKLESLHERLVALSVKEKDSSCTLWLLQGEILRYRSCYKEAEECYERAVAAAGKENDLVNQSKALEGKARIYLDTIQPLHAERLLYQAIELLEKSENAQKTEIAKLYQLLAENLINFGHGSKAAKWLQRAKALNVPLDDGNLEARLYLRTGRFEQARKILLSKKGKPALPQSHRETDLLLSLIAAFTGQGEKAKELAQQGIYHGLNLKAPFVEACGWIRMGHAVQLINKYDIQLAVRCYETALEIMDNLRVEKGKVEAWMGLCYLYGINGEYGQALEAGRQALKETERVKDIWLSALITLSMGIASYYNGRTNEAECHLEKARAMFKECEDDFGTMASHFWLALLSFHSGEKQRFFEYFSTFLKKAEQGDYEFFFHKRTMFGPRDRQVFAPLLIEAQKRGLSPHYVGKLLREMNLLQIDSHPGYTIRIQALGSFRVWVGEKEVEERKWQRGKAKELLQLFITNKSRMIPKEEIFQTLWPGQDEKNAARDFKVALNALNHVLEPNRKARATAFFVIREGAAYGLNPHAGLEMDTAFFEQWLSRGLEEKEMEKARLYLLKGLYYYNGDFLPDRLYVDWCIQERERLMTLYLRGMEKLAQICVRTEEYDAAIDWCQKILNKDATWEEAYRLLMYCFYRKNNRPQAIKWYQKCCEILESELGVGPMNPTIRMYEMILGAEVD